MEGENIKNYRKGRKIAEQLADAISRGDEKIDIGNYPEVEEWINNNRYSESVLENISNADFIAEFNLDTELCKKNANRLRLSAEAHRRFVVRKRIALFSSSVAAAVLALSLLIYDYSKLDLVELSVSENQTVSASLIEPTLILSDGQIVNLTNVNDIVDTKSGVSIKKNQNNKLSYNLINESDSTVKYNTIIIPKMMVYDIELADGTIVTLNANSELKYPTTFNGGKREVFLKGEAYFEVTKNGSPFIVNINDLKVKVYGTKFNINGYESESIKTFLAEGSVGLSFRNGDEVLLTPNKVAVTNTNSGNTIVKEGSTDKYLSWLNGYFMFDSEPLIDVLSDLAKFYDVEFIVENDSIIKRRTVASFDRDMSIVRILKMMEKAGDVRFRQEGRRFYIY